MERVQQAGAIAVREGKAGQTFLLVRAKKDPTAWIFPKGHIDPGETAQDAALRELREEGGVHGTVIGLVGTLEFMSGAEPVRVDYFAVRAIGAAQPSESRERRWCVYEDALSLLSFDGLKDLLAKGRTLAGLER